MFIIKAGKVLKREQPLCRVFSDSLTDCPLESPEIATQAENTQPTKREAREPAGSSVGRISVFILPESDQ